MTKASYSKNNNNNKLHFQANYCVILIFLYQREINNPFNYSVKQSLIPMVPGALKTLFTNLMQISNWLKHLPVGLKCNNLTGVLHSGVIFPHITELVLALKTKKREKEKRKRKKFYNIPVLSNYLTKCFEKSQKFSK